MSRYVFTPSQTLRAIRARKARRARSRRRGCTAAFRMDGGILIEKPFPTTRRRNGSLLRRRRPAGAIVFWISLRSACVGRGNCTQLANRGGIGSVFTPVEKRGRGYAGSVTAALCERIFAEGMSVRPAYTRTFATPTRTAATRRLVSSLTAIPWHYLRPKQVPSPVDGVGGSSPSRIAKSQSEQ